MKTLEFDLRITKIYENHNILREIYINHENLRISFENHEKRENHRIHEKQTKIKKNVEL